METSETSAWRPLAAFRRQFPERQIYYRNGDSVRYVRVSGVQQVLLGVLVLSMLVWTVFVSLVFVLNNTNLVPSSRDAQLAEYQRWTQDLRQNNTIKSLLSEERQSESEHLERKLLILEDLLNELEAAKDSHEHALEGDGAALNQNFTSDQADARVSRDQFQEYTSAGRLVPPAAGTVRAIDQDIHQLVDRIEMYVTDRLALSHVVLNTTALDWQRPPADSGSLTSEFGMGGPEVYLPDLEGAAVYPSDQTTLSTHWPDLPLTGNQFNSRIVQIRAQVSEIQHSEQAIKLFPLAKPIRVSHRVSSPFGMRTDPFTQLPALHMGIDIAASTDSPVVATAPGTVTVAGWRYGYGLMVEVTHSYGIRTRYAHLKSITVTSGSSVQIGSQVGLVGSTGRSTGPHLHYEIWHQGEPLDPMNLLQAGTLSTAYMP